MIRARRRRRLFPEVEGIDEKNHMEDRAVAGRVVAVFIDEIKRKGRNVERENNFP